MANFTIMEQRLATIRQRSIKPATVVVEQPAPATPPIDPSALLTLAEAAALCRVNPRTIRGWNMPFVKVGRIVRIRRGDLDDFVRAISTSSVAR